MKRLAFLITFLFSCSSIFSITWDEPWQEEIMQQSDHFVLGRVLDPKPGSVKIQVIKQFGDKKVEEIITLEGFHMLDICTKNDSDMPSFFFTVIDSVYLFLKKKDIGYCIPTPTSGYAIISNGTVLATFRHSFHQAQLKMAVYEKCMETVWNSMKGLAYDQKFANDFIDKALKQKPAGFKEGEIKLFFNQHVALEMCYLMKITTKYPLIKSFVNASNNHLQISAVRCLANYNIPEAKKLLVDFLKDPAKDNFTKVIAVKSLARISPSELKPELRKIWETASEAPIAFSANPSDPRICTQLPTIKDALQGLLAEL